MIVPGWNPNQQRWTSLKSQLVLERLEQNESDSTFCEQSLVPLFIYKIMGCLSPPINKMRKLVAPADDPNLFLNKKGKINDSHYPRS